MAKTNENASLEDFYEEDLLGNFYDDDDNDDDEEQDDEQSSEDEEENEEEDQDDSDTDDEPEEGDEPEEEAESEDSEEDSEDEEEDEEETPDVEASMEFWNDVDKINGTEFEIDYGDVDPLTPQGAAIREQAVAESAIESFIGSMKQALPKVYQAFEHAKAGGAIEDLFTPGEKDYSKLTISDEDEEHASQVIEEYWRKKGVTDKNKLRNLVQVEMDSEDGVVTAGRSYLKELAAEQDKSREAKLLEAQEAEKKKQDKDQALLDSLQATVQEGKVGNIMVTKKDTAPFFEYVKSKLQRTADGGYIVVDKLDASELEAQLKYEYFKYKKGDLSKLIEAKAKTENVRRLKTNVRKAKAKPKSSSTGGRNKGPASLKDFEQD